MDGVPIVGAPTPSAGDSDDPFREAVVIATRPFSAQALRTMPEYWNVRVAFALNGSDYDYTLKLMLASAFSPGAVLERDGKCSVCLSPQPPALSAACAAVATVAM